MIACLGACEAPAPSPSVQAQDLVGEWEGVRSTGGWLNDTISYVRPGDEYLNRVAWRLSLTRDNRFVSHRSGERVAGTYTLTLDTLDRARANQHVLTFSADIWDTADYHPVIVADSLVLVNAWTDSYDHVFVRVRDTGREVP